MRPAGTPRKLMNPTVEIVVELRSEIKPKQQPLLVSIEIGGLDTHSSAEKGDPIDGYRPPESLRSGWAPADPWGRDFP